MIVLRVAHIDFIHRRTQLPAGPYISGEAMPVSSHDPRKGTPHLSCYGPGRMPCPDNDGIGTITDTNLVCAFRDRDQLVSWFGDSERDWAEAEQNGWRIFEYEVPEEHVFHGECQVVFDPAYARETARHLPAAYARGA